MRSLIIFIILIASLKILQAQSHKSADSLLYKRISLTAKDSNIGEILTKITAAYQVPFSYIESTIPLKNKVSVSAENIALEQALTQLFINTNVIFFQVHDQIILSK